MENGSEFESIVRSRENGSAVMELARDYRTPQHAVWGIQARNREQNFALNVLMDPSIDFVTLLGTAGTGKTLLTLASGLMLTLEDKSYREIIMTRETVPLGEDIGFLPGTEEEKMSPWMGALHDNLELLSGQEASANNQWERSATQQVLMSKISVRSLNFMRGRTFQQRFIILDEAQNLTSKQIKTLITRAGPGTKIVCLGDIAQIDTPYLTGTTSGLTYAVDRFKNWPHAAHISMRRGERSRLADYAADAL
jgi:PhoH-like ATPase